MGVVGFWIVPGVTAFMFGKIKVDGDVGVAIKLGKVLS
jgi:putative sterol carrier protein